MSSSATVGVEKATSDLLIGPDWTMNIDICDSINSYRWQAKDVVKVLKKRLQNKNPKVQLLALTLLETMIKNCGDNVHFQIAERNILQEMIKTVKKKTDMHVRDKILVLLDSWQEAFGGPGGKYPQYYWAYEELRRSGVEFPQRSRDAAPIFTPPVANPMLRHSQAGYGMPSDTSRRLDEAMASEMENLSLSNLDSMQSVQELLADMLQALNPNDREAVKDEVIVDLVSQCRSNQRKLMQMLTSTGDEELLCQGLALNDSLQSLLAKHDAIASGSPLPTEVIRNSSLPTEVRDASPISNATAATPIASVTSSQLEEEEEEDDDFAQLARRRTKISTVPSESAPTGIGQGATPPSTSSPSNALVLTTPPTAVRTTTTKEQDMIDLLSITLSTTSTSPRTPPSTSNQNVRQVPVSPTTDGYPYGQRYTENQGQIAYSSYVAPWAQPQAQPAQPRAWVQPQQPQPWTQPQAQTQQPQAQPQLSQAQPWARPQPQTWSQPQPQLWAQPQPQPQPPPQPQPQAQPQLTTQQSFSYPPPPWATAPANSSQSPLSTTTTAYDLRTTQANPSASSSYMPMHVARPLQTHNSFPSRGNNGKAIMYGEAQVVSFPQRLASLPTGQKTFVPSYRLFEDLNVLGSADGASSNSPRMSGQSMMGGRK